ncbi:patatin-like phospholipase family protein [Clostridium tarantellae]|uniref:Patatin-like phospholipase family protein n=1 Tax=Clostridium tarantellae TaxID=39493 RepID=A0A6I1ML86_9CLOT|nr:patatin-like phospholipase family protein [Clostridium tarantellae]MPQ44266.1 patatin-like phospholipase family protein [Clostridium tarantellae]
MKIGLVLSGGGGKGAYELGVWKALKEMQLDSYIKVFSGTSIGAFNAVLFAQDDLERAEALWDEVTMEMLVPLTKFALLKKGLALALGVKSINFVKKYMHSKLESGNVPKDGVINIVNKYIDINKMKENDRICYAACTEMPDFKPKYFKINDFEEEEGKDIILASASLPLIYECAEINGKKYLDGGMIDNTPIQPVYGEGCDFIIVVLLSKESTIDRSLYPNAKIIELAPRELDESMLSGTLNLDSEAKKNRIMHGYNDTKNLLEPILELAKEKHIEEQQRRYPIIFKSFSVAKDIKEAIYKKVYGKNNDSDDIAN